MSWSTHLDQLESNVKCGPERTKEQCLPAGIEPASETRSGLVESRPLERFLRKV
jgi:hypothetical protein